MVHGKRRAQGKKAGTAEKKEADSMNEEEPFYKNWRVLLLIAVILGSLAAIASLNLKYGLDLEGGSWLQLQLQGGIAQLDADPGKIVQVEFARLLNDPSIRVEETTFNSVTFTTSKEITQKTIDDFGFGKSSVSKGADGNTRVILQTNKILSIQKYLENNLNAEVIPDTVNVGRFEIRRSVTADELNKLLNPVGGKVLSLRDGVTEETLQLTKKILDDKFSTFGFKESPTRPVGNQYLLVDLAGMDMATARDIAAKPGKFEIRIQVKGNETEHILYGDQITDVGIPEKDKRGAWGVSFSLTDEGASALRDAAIKYDAVTNPDAHELIMYLDENIVFNGAMVPELARNIKNVPVKSMTATTGTGDAGQTKAKELQTHLRAGALPVNVEVIGSGQVPAELGSKFKEQLAISGIIALILVAIVVSLRYKQPNIIIPMLATSFSEVIIILGFTAVFGFQLDLATITGIIAVIGTGVDHLIIITDEVLAEGAMPSGKIYKSRLAKAFAIIFSAAATVLVAMLPLWFMGFGALRGFAVITIVGVLIGVFIARPAYAEIIQGLIVVDAGKKYVEED